ncbi:IclR family transcriptional regulator [Cupriavidus basilensis]
MDAMTSKHPQDISALEDDRRFVTALARGLEILGAFDGGGLLGNQDISSITGLPGATVSRLTYTLASLGYLRRDEQSRKYFVGAGVLGLSASIQRSHGVQKIARGFMEALSRERKVSVAMGTRDRLGVMFLEVARCDQTVKVVHVDVGTVLPMGSTAMGTAYLVAAPLAERAHLLEQMQERHGAEWEQIRKSVERAHSDYRKHGFVISLRSWSRPVNAVGVPLVMPIGGGIYAFTCVANPQAAPRERLVKELGPRLVEMVNAIRAEVDRSPPLQVVPHSVYRP